MCNVELEYVQLRKSGLFFVFSKLLWKVSKNLVQVAMLVYINMALVGNIVTYHRFFCFDTVGKD